MGRDQRPKGHPRRPAAATSWDPLAAWYDGWVGEGGSHHHKEIAVPATLRLLDARPGEHILDAGCGQGVLAPEIHRQGAIYTGVDASPRMIQLAQKHHSGAGRFLLGDARHLDRIRGLSPGSFDAVIFLLSLQDMDPLAPSLHSAARALKPSGRMVLLLTHPAFRVPRQSGWGWDEPRKLIFRRVDRYLSPLPVPMKTFPGKDQVGSTRSFHRPLEQYINGLSDQGLLIDRLHEIPGRKVMGGRTAKAETMARQEIPLFLAMRARRVSPVLDGSYDEKILDAGGS